MAKRNLILVAFCLFLIAAAPATRPSAGKVFLEGRTPAEVVPWVRESIRLCQEVGADKLYLWDWPMPLVDGRYKRLPGDEYTADPTVWHQLDANFPMAQVIALFRGTGVSPGTTISPRTLQRNPDGSWQFAETTSFHRAAVTMHQKVVAGKTLGFQHFYVDYNCKVFHDGTWATLPPHTYNGILDLDSQVTVLPEHPYTGIGSGTGSVHPRIIQYREYRRPRGNTSPLDVSHLQPGCMVNIVTDQSQTIDTDYATLRPLALQGYSFLFNAWEVGQGVDVHELALVRRLAMPPTRLERMAWWFREQKEAVVSQAEQKQRYLDAVYEYRKARREDH